MLESKRYFHCAVTFVTALHMFIYYLGETALSIMVVGIGMQMVYLFLLHDFPILVMTWSKLLLLTGKIVNSFFSTP